MSCLRSTAIWSCLIAIGAGAASAAGQTRPAKVELTVSKETTYLLGPLNPDGTVNYVAAMNEMLGRGVTKANNAAMVLLQAFGPELLYEKARPNMLKALGMADLPAAGAYYVPARKHVAEEMLSLIHI